jgi:dihydropteroate synthase
MNTLKQFHALAGKLLLQPFGLTKSKGSIESLLSAIRPQPSNCCPQKSIPHQRTLVMGILNVTPDSFSDGGLFTDVEVAVEHAERMVAEGADIIDIGGESSRPGADPVTAEIEMDRVLPVIEKLAKTIEIPISIDTYRSSVARKALDAGACIVNDISALRGDADMASVVAEAGVPVVLMHMKGTPKDMQIDPHYDCVISEIISFLRTRIQTAVDAGISPDHIIIDPGIGFGKTLANNLEIIRRLRDFRILDVPILIGTSRKSFIGKVLGLNTGDRIEGTAATVAVAIANGADIVRVHDVKEMAKVVRMTDAIVRGGQ